MQMYMHTKLVTVALLSIGSGLNICASEQWNNLCNNNRLEYYVALQKIEETWIWLVVLSNVIQYVKEDSWNTIFYVERRGYE